MMMQRSTPRQMAENLFDVLTGCAVFFGLMSGCFATADCLSEEKREGTLGLLFLTDLAGYDVVLGKLVANSLNAFYTMASLVPLLAVPLILGGLTPGDFVRMALVAADALFFSLAAGVFVSSICRSSSKSVGLTFLLVLLMTAILPACGAFITYHGNRSGSVPPIFLLPSAFYAYALASYQSYQLWAARFWESLLVINALGWACLVAASEITPRVWQDRPAGRQRIRWRERWQQWWRSGAEERTSFRRRMLNQNPFLWLASRLRYKAAFVWIGFALIAAGWLWGLAEYRREWLTEPGYYIFTAFCAHVFLRVRLASETPWQLAEERKAGTLELLLSTPLTVSEIVRGHWLALQRQFLAPVMLIVGLDLLALIVPFWAHSWAGWDRTERSVWIAVWLGAAVLMLADAWAFFWVGSWQGLTAKTALRAAANSFGNLFMAPCSFYALFLLWLVFGFVTRPMRPTWQPGPLVFFWAWILPRLTTDFAAGLYARERLLRQFRLAAQMKRNPRPGLWGWWLGQTLSNVRKSRDYV